MPLKQHPTDPDKVVYVRRQHDLTPPQRPWVGLTEEEIKECFKITPDLYLTWHIYERIETKLKEKNS